MSKRVSFAGGVLSLFAVVSAVALVSVVGSAGAAAPISAIGSRLHATLSPVGAASGSGQLDALLIGRFPPLPGPLGPPVQTQKDFPRTMLPTGCHLVTSPSVSSSRVRIKCGAEPVFSVPTEGGHWLLVWRLTFSNLTGAAAATIQLPAVVGGATPTVVATLCSSCGHIMLGHLTLTAAQGTSVLRGRTFADVQSPNGELRGRILLVRSIVFKA